MTSITAPLTATTLPAMYAEVDAIIARAIQDQDPGYESLTVFSEDLDISKEQIAARFMVVESRVDKNTQKYTMTDAETGLCFALLCTNVFDFGPVYRNADALPGGVPAGCVRMSGWWCVLHGNTYRYLSVFEQVAWDALALYQDRRG